MRILQVCSASQLGGGEIHVSDLVRALADRGHALFLAVRPNSPLRALLSGVIASWHEVPMKNSLDVKSASAITEIINQYGIDIVHAHVGRDYLITAMASRRAKKHKLVLTRHHYLPIKQNAIYRWMLKDVAAVIAVSAGVRESVIERLALPEERVHEIPNWVDPSRFQLVDRDAARAMFRLNAKLNVACIGQVTPPKGQEDFVRAAARVARMRADVEFLIVGEEQDEMQPFSNKLSDIAAQLGMGDRLRFLGHVEFLPDLLAAVDVVVVPSWDEGFSLVTIEALAAKRAVLASDVGGIRGIIKDSQTGLLVPARDSNAMANKLLWMLSDAPLRERLALQGQRDVYARYGRDQIIDRIESLYLDLLENDADKGK